MPFFKDYFIKPKDFLFSLGNPLNSSKIQYAPLMKNQTSKHRSKTTGSSADIRKSSLFIVPTEPSQLSFSGKQPLDLKNVILPRNTRHAFGANSM